MNTHTAKKPRPSVRKTYESFLQKYLRGVVEKCIHASQHISYLDSEKDPHNTRLFPMYSYVPSGYPNFEKSCVGLDMRFKHDASELTWLKSLGSAAKGHLELKETLQGTYSDVAGRNEPCVFP